MPTPSHETKRYGVSDAKIYRVTGDTASAYTYGPGIDVPGIKAITLDAQTSTKTLRGDNSLIDSMISLDSISGTIQFAKDSQDVTAAALGLTVEDDTNTSELMIDGEATPQPLRLEAIAAGSDFVSGGVKLYIAKLYMVPIAGFAEEDYQTMSVPFTCTPTVWRDSNSKRVWVGTINSSVAITASA